MKPKGYVVTALVTAIAASALLLVTMASADATVVVSPSHTQGWSTADTRPGGAVSFVTDSTAPGGAGALQLTTTDSGTAKAQYMHEANVPLSQVADLSYSTKQVSASFAGGDASYQLPVCLGGVTSAGCVGFTTLVFEPYQNLGLGSNPTEVAANTWQSWDVDAGQFWSSRSYTDGANCSVTAGGGGAPFYTLSALQAACPNAVVSGFGVNIGSGNPGYNVYVDLVRFNGTTYDFEPDSDGDGIPNVSDNCPFNANPGQEDFDGDGTGDACEAGPVKPTNKEQCKNNGWTNWAPRFKNQGDCIQYANTTK